jgi:lipopolysaccharide export system protein LptA
MDETLPVLLEGDTSFRKPTGVYVLSGNVYIESEDDE